MLTPASAAGLKLDPENAALKQGLASAHAEQARSSRQQQQQDPMAMLGNMFGPQLIPQLMQNPKFKGYLQDPSFMAMLGDIQKDPNKLGSHLSDPRLQEVLAEVMGINIQGAPGAGAGEAGGDPSQTAGTEPEPQQEPEPEPEPEQEVETEEEREERLRREAEEKEARERRCVRQAVAITGVARCSHAACLRSARAPTRSRRGATRRTRRSSLMRCVPCALLLPSSST